MLNPFSPAQASFHSPHEPSNIQKLGPPKRGNQMGPPQEYVLELFLGILTTLGHNLFRPELGARSHCLLCSSRLFSPLSVPCKRVPTISSMEPPNWLELLPEVRIKQYSWSQRTGCHNSQQHCGRLKAEPQCQTRPNTRLPRRSAAVPLPAERLFATKLRLPSQELAARIAAPHVCLRGPPQMGSPG